MPHMIIARLNDRARPMDRGDLYEDPLDEFLQAGGLGSVSGGGTQLGDLGEIAYCDVEIEWEGPVDEAKTVIVRELEKCGAPRGSKLLIDDEEIEFGQLEGLGVYLNGSDLPKEVYSQCDANHVYEQFEQLLGDRGSIHSHWQGPTETALYLYGPSFEEMLGLVSGFIGSYPLCERARCVKIA